jgi:2,4-dienoyl-CoA reductase-like NADH-dependent reductase (Old Yellow Enzyme family)/thioredoxin reductase
MQEGDGTFKQLFSPFTLKGVTLQNRIVMPGLASFLIEEDGGITEKTVEHYRRRAAGGPAMVIVEACAVAPEGIVSPHQARIYDERFVEGLARIARSIKEEGSVPAVQIHHGGRQTSPRVIGRKPFAPSPLPCPTIRGEVEPLNRDGIRLIVDRFGDAAARAVDAGFELIEVHGAHGYLINQFLSGFSNIREDEYGGNVLNRSRFAREVVEEIRRRVGPDYPVAFKISAQEFVPGGLDVDESIEILKQIIPYGIDSVQVSAGNDATPEWICQPMFMKKACLADSAALIRRALKLPIMAVGRINSPEIADDIITKGKADLVCIGRGLLADPKMPIKAREGRLDDIRTCIACNTCMESIFRKGRVECLVNPTLGRERDMKLIPAATPKRVMVVGGGPGGLDAACVAARRGHEVHLYEIQEQLGGQLLLGAVTSYKRELLSLITYQKRQAEKYGVRFHLGHRVTPDAVADFRPDALVLATGSVPDLPPVPGMDSPIVVSLSQMLSDSAASPGSSYVVIGGGATGCELALYLAEKGCSVTVVEKLMRIGPGIESVTRKMILERLAELGVTLMTGFEVERVQENGVCIRNREGDEHFLEAEGVAVVTGMRPENDLHEKVVHMGIPIYRIGDCLEPRSAKAAIFEGAVIGRKI